MGSTSQSSQFVLAAGDSVGSRLPATPSKTWRPDIECFPELAVGSFRLQTV